MIFVFGFFVFVMFWVNCCCRFASYTTQKSKSVSPSSLDTVPLLGNIKISNSQSSVSKLTAKVAPIKPKTPTPRTLATSPIQKSNSASNTSTARSSFFILSSLSRNSSNCAEQTSHQKNHSVDAIDSKANDKMVNENKRNEYSAEKRKKDEKLRKKAENEAKKVRCGRKFWRKWSGRWEKFHFVSHFAHRKRSVRPKKRKNEIKRIWNISHYYVITIKWIAAKQKGNINYPMNSILNCRNL